jgi:cob(I)alamin adenosyltransferase
MKIYTKTGDDGTTGLLGSSRMLKDAPRIEAYGTVDELNAILGTARTSRLGPDADALLSRIQQELFEVGAALADPNPAGRFHHVVSAEHITRLESEIDAMEAQLAPLTQFIVPGGSSAAAFAHLARTVCRRAERQVVRLTHEPAEQVPNELVVYLNRLSDWLFVLARRLNREDGVADIPWRGL